MGFGGYLAGCGSLEEFVNIINICEFILLLILKFLLKVIVDRIVNQD